MRMKLGNNDWLLASMWLFQVNEIFIKPKVKNENGWMQSENQLMMRMGWICWKIWNFEIKVGHMETINFNLYTSEEYDICKELRYVYNHISH